MWGYTVLLAMVLHWLLRLLFGAEEVGGVDALGVLVWLLCLGFGRWAAPGLVAMRDEARRGPVEEKM